MDNVEELRNTSLLSQSYIAGVKRVAKKCQKDETEFHISEEILDSRKRTWTWLFEKFSEDPDDVELNLWTLKPDTESDGSHDSDYRVPVRKSEAQMQYWIDTGNPPCQLNEAEDGDTDGTVSISESEASELQSRSSTSMIVNKELTTSTNQLVDGGTSGSSVDTATYINTNKNATKKPGSLSVEKDPRATNFANLENNRVSRSINERMAKVALSRSMESPRNMKLLENNSVLHKSTPAVSIECNPRLAQDVYSKGDVVGEPLRFEQIKLSNLRESEVTYGSKESGIGSLPVQNTEINKKAKRKTSTDSLDEIISTQKKSKHRMRKLYTGNNSFFDLYGPPTQTLRENRSVRYSIHPALSSTTTEQIKKRKFRLSLLTLPGNLKARKSRLHCANASRAKNKSRRKSVLSEVKIVENSDASLIKNVSQTKEASAVVADKVDFAEACPIEDVDTHLKETPPKSLILSTKKKKIPKVLPSPTNSSSSLSSGDVSQIINEKLYGVSNTPLVELGKKKSLKPSSIAKVRSPQGGNHDNDFTVQILSDTQGSIFKPEADASPETIKNKMQNMLRAKKNLYAIDLRSSESNDSPLASSSSRRDSVDDASSTLVHDLREKIAISSRESKKSRETVTDIGSKVSASHHLDPVVVLHDFRSLEKFCEKLDREIYEKWIRKKNATDERLDTKLSRMKKSKKLLDSKILTTKKLKLETKAAAALKSDEKILSHKIITNDSYSDEEFLPYLKDEGPAVDCVDADNNDRQNRKSPDRDNVTVTFITTNCEKESLFVLTSSEDENIFEKLMTKRRSESSKRKCEKKAADKKLVNFIGKNGSVEYGATSQDSKFSLVKYKIVSSSSENEENTINKHSHPAKSQRPKRKLSKQNEGKDYSPDSVATMCSTQDRCSDKSESLQDRDEKLEKQSPGVNKSLETSKSKQPLDLRGGFLAARSEVDNGSQSHRKSRAKVRRKSNDSESVVSNESENEGVKKKENENCTQRVSEESETPSNRGSNRLPKRDKDTSANTSDDSKKINSTKDLKDVKLTKKSVGSLRNKRRKSFRKIFTDSTESDEESEIRPTHSNEDRKRTSSKNVHSRRALVDAEGGRTSDDESSTINDAMTFLSKNNAGSYSMLKEKKNDDVSLIISSYENSASPVNRGIKIKNNVSNCMKEKLTKPKKKSTIIFKTKEYWESDSD